MRDEKEEKEKEEKREVELNEILSKDKFDDIKARKEEN